MQVVTVAWWDLALLVLGVLTTGAISGIPIGVWIWSLPAPGQRPHSCCGHAATPTKESADDDDPPRP